MSRARYNSGAQHNHVQCTGNRGYATFGTVPEFKPQPERQPNRESPTQCFDGNEYNDAQHNHINYDGDEGFVSFNAAPPGMAAKKDSESSSEEDQRDDGEQRALVIYNDPHRNGAEHDRVISKGDGGPVTFNAQEEPKQLPAPVPGMRERAFALANSMLGGSTASAKCSRKKLKVGTRMRSQRGCLARREGDGGSEADDEETVGPMLET